MIQTFDLQLPHGITLACRAAGVAGRPLLLFLHGFPEAAFVWDELLQHFAEPEHGGYHAVAPNLRGYAGSSAPPTVADYRASALIGDLVALIEQLGGGTPLAALVAHDWGGALAWGLAAQRPDLLQRLLILNAPHPQTFRRELAHDAAQQAASAYMNQLTLPQAEACLAADDFRRLWRMLAPDGHAGWLDEALRAQYRAVWQGDGLRGPLNYYRATPLRPPSPDDAGAAALQLAPDAGTVRVPTWVLWGLRDEALRPSLLDGLASWVPRLQVQPVPEASHWIVHEQPARVTAALAAALRQPV